MFLNHLGRPSIYLSICMALWGLVSALTGVAQNFVDVLLTRFFLGICECAFFPVSCRWGKFQTGSHGAAGCLVPPFKMVQTQ